MNTSFEKVLEPAAQSALADEIVSMVAAVVSNTSAPDSAIRALAKNRQDTLAPEQRAAAAALQAYGARNAATVFTVALEPQAVARANELQKALEAATDGDALTLLESDPEAGEGFKERMSLAIATKCAQLIATEIERVKTGPVKILNEDDAKLFEENHVRHQTQRTEAAVSFLRDLPVRFPTFGAHLFHAIRRDVQNWVEESYKRPDIHAAVSTLFDDAMSAMPPDVRKKLA
ncbi:hypothetical protein ACFQUU_12490 [Herbaspirillum sp. GCM10030257]|uniref:hypothetical protein n=1 Tax=Herbaspirillum sp. GCM10030257 TaxID=3273393 RepID=UPI003623FA63